MGFVTTAERVSRSSSDNFVFQRSILAYHFAAEQIGKYPKGNVLEIGTGVGYGIDIIAQHAEKFISMDKSLPAVEGGELPRNVTLVEGRAPKLPFADESFDWVVTFQVVEHIKEDCEFIDEIHRVLKRGGRLILSTPNAPMSLTRNPWHVREYTADELEGLLAKSFSVVVKGGVRGNERVMSYFEKNRKGVESITRFDPLRLQYRLPRWMLKIPYDVLNRLNRRRLLNDNQELTQSITMEDYSVVRLCECASKDAFDLLYIAGK